MAKKNPKGIGDIWKKSPPSKTLIIPSREHYPGRGFAERGARWLSAELRSNIPMKTRRKYARMCFTEAIERCNTALKRAKQRGQNDEVKRLAEVVIWLDNWLKTI